MDEMKQYAVGPASLADTAEAKGRRRARRPLVVWLVLAYAILWVGGIVFALSQMNYLAMLDSGQRSLLSEVVGFAFPLTVLIGALYLLAMRKAAIWIFGAHALWSIFRIVQHRGDLFGLAIDIAVTIYAWRLAQRGELR